MNIEGIIKNLRSQFYVYDNNGKPEFGLPWFTEEQDLERLESFLSQALSEMYEEGFREGQKNGKLAYKGQMKREWYMRGFEQGKKDGYKSGINILHPDFIHGNPPEHAQEILPNIHPNACECVVCSQQLSCGCPMVDENSMCINQGHLGYVTHNGVTHDKNDTCPWCPAKKQPALMGEEKECKCCQCKYCHVNPWDIEHCSRCSPSQANAEKEKIKRNIGQLRQWLNENRITDPNKMVTNQELEMWIFGLEE